jgi:hypothetical protein
MVNRKQIGDDMGSSPVKNVHDQEAPSSPVAPLRKRKREEPEIDIADKVIQLLSEMANPDRSRL